MKHCAYCGGENADGAAACIRCGTGEFKEAAQRSPDPVPEGERYEIPPLSEAARANESVVLVTCRTLVDADMVTSRLKAVGITANVPDEALMQMTPWPIGVCGFVRVQIAPADHEAARLLLNDVVERQRHA